MIAEVYAKLVEEVAALAASCGRNPNEIRVVAVSKGYPWSAVIEAYRAGCRDFGESRLQEAAGKFPLGPSDLRWHLVGSLQKNKVRKAVGRFALIHSVDTPELAQKIDAVSAEEGLVTKVLLQVNTSGETTKHGLTGDAWRTALDLVAPLKHIEILGLMTMGPNVEEEAPIRAAFRRLRILRDEFSELLQRPLPGLSMGMSHDYRLAIEEGATWLRIGTKIFKQS